MQAIFASASQVLASIELAESDTDKVLLFANAVRPALDPLNQPPEVYHIVQDTSTVSALARLCHHKYWTRVWILQEFAIGRPLHLLINTVTIPLQTVKFMVDLAFNEHRSLRFHSMQLMLYARACWQAGQRLSLISLLQHMSEFECGVRTDRVFGVLGLVSDGMTFLPEPSYNLGCNEWSVLMTKSYMAKQGIDVILLGSGPQNGLDALPSWCPDYFRFDKRRPDNRVFNIVVRSQNLSHTGTSASFEKNRFWCATGRTSSQMGFDDQLLRSAVRRIGVIKSLGAACSDPKNYAYPKHDKEWAHNCKLGNVADLTLHVFLAAIDLLQFPGDQPKLTQITTWFGWRHILFTYTHLFHTRHGRVETGDEPMSNFARWVCANRNFYASGACLQIHAGRIPHPFVYFWNVFKFQFARASTKPYFWFCGWAYQCLNLILLVLSSIFHIIVMPASWRDEYGRFSEMAEADMRLMCLDETSLGIGWAARSADLGDEVYLIPGCCVPVILRWNETKGFYQFIGDAIVVGAMFNEIWGKTKAEDLTNIEIG
jgi:hypothetical protein